MRHPSKIIPEFNPSLLENIPVLCLRDFEQVFSDIDYGKAGRVSVDEVREALFINSLDVPDHELELALSAMEKLTGGEGCGFVNSEAFSRCIHALSLHQRDLLPAYVYSEFPDSSFVILQDSLQLRRSLWLALEDPLSSSFARALSVVLVLVIMLSTVSFCVETVPSLHRRYESVFYGIEIFSVLIFTLELMARIVCTPYLSTFFSSTMNVIDILAVAPFYLELLVTTAGSTLLDASSASILRAMRLIRVFRLLKVGRYLAWLRVLGRTMKASLGPLGMVLYVTIILILLSSSSLYYFERGVWDPNMVRPVVDATASSIQRRALGEVLTEGGLGKGESRNGTLLGAWVDPDTGKITAFQSIPATFWWCIITMTGVGYGDMYPITPWGKVLAGATFFAGILLSAVPISIISSNFHTEYESMKRLQGIAETHAQQPPPNAFQPKQDKAAGLETGGGATHSDSLSVPPATVMEVEETQKRLCSAWSEPFLRSTLQVVRNGRRKLMATIKSKELISREHASTDLVSVVSDIKDSALDRASVVLKQGEKGLL